MAGTKSTPEKPIRTGPTGTPSTWRQSRRGQSCQSEQTRRHRRRRAIARATDVSLREDLDQFVDTDVGQFGRLDVCVSNAGISKIGPVADLDVDGWSAMIDVNLRGLLYGIAAACRFSADKAAGIW